MKSGQAQPETRGAVATTSASMARSSPRRCPASLAPRPSLQTRPNPRFARFSAFCILLALPREKLTPRHSPPVLPLSRVNIGSSARCYRITTRSAHLSVHSPTRHSPPALLLSQISNLKSQMPSAPRPSPLARTIFPSSGKILPLSQNIPP